MNNKKWKRLSGTEIKQFAEEIYADIEKHGGSDKEFEFSVGCDSQVRGEFVTYVIAVAFRRIGNGGSVYFYKDKEPLNNAHLQQRLWTETQKAVETAVWLNTILEPKGHLVTEVHADLNPSNKHKSNKAVKMCSGYITAEGFIPVVKPDGYMASTIADSKTRGSRI